MTGQDMIVRVTNDIKKVQNPSYESQREPNDGSEKWLVINYRTIPPVKKKFGNKGKY
jgi:hypothetical protein